MQKIFGLLAITTLAACNAGDVKINGNSYNQVGSAEIVNKSYKKLSIFGKTTLDKVTVKKLNVCGKLTATKSTINSLSSTGKTILQESIIGEVASINGSLFALESKAKDIFVCGKAEFKKTIITGKSNLSGLLTAKDSSFGEIVIKTKHRIILSDSETKTINIKGPSLLSKEVWPDEQIVELNNTKVDGNIIFENNKGKIILNGNSKINGKIIGGILEKK